MTVALVAVASFAGMESVTFTTMQSMTTSNISSVSQRNRTCAESEKSCDGSMPLKNRTITMFRKIRTRKPCIQQFGNALLFILSLQILDRHLHLDRARLNFADDAIRNEIVDATSGLHFGDV
jgi:hypothetical protein